jgi:CRP-like cAMP-binding protein
VEEGGVQSRELVPTREGERAADERTANERTDDERVAARANGILRTLSDADLGRLLSDARRERLRVGERLYRPGQRITEVFFPLDSVISVVTTMKDGGTVEVATVGKEGLVGVPVFLGAEAGSNEAFMQIPGDLVRMPAQAFRDELERVPVLRDTVARYTQALFALVTQSAACNRLHSIEERLARWLLMCRDRTTSDELPLTQEFLADMLGVRRPSVTLAAGIIQKAGLIRYNRGRIAILDRQGLEDAACECYGVVRDEFERLLGPAD